MRQRWAIMACLVAVGAGLVLVFRPPAVEPRQSKPAPLIKTLAHESTIPPALTKGREVPEGQYPASYHSWFKTRSKFAADVQTFIGRGALQIWQAESKKDLETLVREASAELLPLGYKLERTTGLVEEATFRLPWPKGENAVLSLPLKVTIIDSGGDTRLIRISSI